MQNKLILYICLIGFCASVAILWFMHKPCAATTSTLIIGTAAGYAPFVSINQQGEYEGFDIDVAHALAKQMNKKVVLQDLGSMTPLFIALDQGTIDAIIWGLSITPQRLQKIAMIRYQGSAVTAYPLLFWGNIPAHVHSIQDMQNMTVCVEPSSAQDSILTNYPFITKKYVERVDDALLQIQYGKADAAFVEPAIAKKFMQKYPEIKQLDVPLEQKDQELGIGIAVKQNNMALQKDIEHAIDALTSNGVIAELEKKWNMS
jgi:arginine transport system substrate-binding protein